MKRSCEAIEVVAAGLAGILSISFLNATSSFL
jgi:hypothetical protein